MARLPISLRMALTESTANPVPTNLHMHVACPTVGVMGRVGVRVRVRVDGRVVVG